MTHLVLVEEQQAVTLSVVRLRKRILNDMTHLVLVEELDDFPELSSGYHLVRRFFLAERGYRFLHLQNNTNTAAIDTLRPCPHRTRDAQRSTKNEISPLFGLCCTVLLLLHCM